MKTIGIFRWIFLIFVIGKALGQSTNSSNSTFDFNTYFPGFFWDLFLACAIFVFISCCGICQIMGVQTHDRVPVAVVQHEEAKN